MIEFLTHPTGRFIISVIWAIGIATMFMKSCNDRNCRIITYHGPDPNKVQNRIYQGIDACTKFTPYVTSC